MRNTDNGIVIGLKWAYSHLPKVGDLYVHGGQSWRITSYVPTGLPSYDRKQVTLCLEPY